jgi:hypothetical protein
MSAATATPETRRISEIAGTPATTTPEIAGKPVTAGTGNYMYSYISNSRGVRHNTDASNSK